MYYDLQPGHGLREALENPDRIDDVFVARLLVKVSERLEVISSEESLDDNPEFSIEGFTKLIFDAESGFIVGGAIVGTHAGDMIGEICLAIEMGCDAADIGKTIHPHPTLGESIGMPAEVALGTCTDLPPQRKRK